MSVSGDVATRPKLGRRVASRSLTSMATVVHGATTDPQNTVVIPRWYGTSHRSDKSQVLHVFTDASEKAYGAVAYLQGQIKDGQETVTTLVASKSRVAPIKTITLPRLELMGAVIGARLATNLLKALNMETSQLQMWSDSMIVIHWICSSSRKWKQFVANRVMEIQTLTPPELWSHCNGKMNPADLTTRGQPASRLKEEELWWSGPPFLKSKELQMTLSETKVKTLTEEAVRAELKASHVTVNLSNSERLQSEPLLQLEKYSKLQTVLSHCMDTKISPQLSHKGQEKRRTNSRGAVKCRKGMDTQGTT